MDQLHLGVEDVVDGLDELGADLGGELHRQPRALDREHGLRRIRRRARGELLGGLGRVALLGGELADDLGEAAGARRGRRARRRRVLKGADAPLGADRGDSSGGGSRASDYGVDHAQCQRSDSTILQRQQAHLVGRRVH